MYTTRTRRPDRFHLIHHVIARLRDRGYFSAAQLAGALYHGSGPRPHQEQRKRVRQMLGRYVEARLLEKHNAACLLYRHRDVTEDDVDKGLVFEFEAHACRRWSKSDEMFLRLVDHDLDRLIPRDADPECFTSSGALLPNPMSEALRDNWGRPLDTGPPSALAYVREQGCRTQAVS
jgi:hypothetical protein